MHLINILKIFGSQNETDAAQSSIGSKFIACSDFNRLLRSLYSLPFGKLASWHELIRITNLADYYGMLRPFSTSLEGSISELRVL
jgi:hypothetical protein